MSEQATRRRARRAAGSFPNAWTIFHVRGVPIRVDASWWLIAALVVWLFFSRFTGLLGHRGTAVAVGAATLATLLFFSSLLVHELGHAITSIQRGIPVVSVTLFLMGGVTESVSEAKRARDEFVIVGIGPYLSLVLAGIFGLLYVPFRGAEVTAAIFGYLAWANLMLAVFNVIPGYPLDGGRLLRAIFWGVTKDPHRATRWAARVGQVFAVALMALGIWSFVGTGGGGFGGLWEVLIGFFLYRGAAEAHARAKLRGRIAGTPVTAAMGTAPPPLDPELPLREALVRLQERPSLLWPVGDPLRGVFTLARIDDVPEADWERVRVGEVALDTAGSVVAVDASLDLAVELLGEAPHGMLLVERDGRVVGLLTPSLVAGVEQ